MTVQSLLSLRDGAVEKSKLHILACASPIMGHTIPIINIVEELVQRGYTVSFIAGPEFQARIEQIGARFFGIPPIDIVGFKKEMEKFQDGIERNVQSLNTLFVEPTAARMEALYNSLEVIKSQFPSQKIVILTESFYLGDHPLYLGAPLPRGFTKRPRSVNIHAVPYVIQSRDTPPFGHGILPEKLLADQNRYEAQWEEYTTKTYGPVMALQEKMLLELGCVDYKPSSHFDILSLSADVTLQMCPPSLEYERSDVHPKVRFAGAIKGRPRLKGFPFPPWWDEVTSGEKRVVVVSQGTVAVNYEHLLVPTLKALEHRSDLLVVALLGKRGATLAADVTIPNNTRVIDYLPYDAVLPHASAFVMNAGYGGFIHSALNGVPMILAGDSEDKPEVAARGEYAGIAVNLRTGTPSVSQVYEAVDLVLADSRFKSRVMQIKQENEDMRAMDTVEDAILEMALLD